MDYTKLLQETRKRLLTNKDKAFHWLSTHTKAIAITGCAIGVVYVLATFGIKYQYKKYQSQIVAKIEEAINRKVVIAKQPSLRLSTLLNPKLNFENLSISNANWSKNPNMLYVEKLDAQLSLMKLLLGKILITKLEIKNPKLVLEKKSNNQTNWSSFTKPDSDSKKASFFVDDINIIGGEIAYIDHLSGDTQKFKFKEFKITNIYNQNINLILNTKYNGETLKCTANLSFSDTHFNLDNLKLIYASSDLAGDFKLNTKTNKIKSHFGSNNLDLDKIKALSKNSEQDTKLPLNFLKYRQVDIKLDIAKLKFNKQKINDLTITATQKNNDLTVKFTPIEIYGGIVESKITSDLDNFSHRVNLNFKNLALNSLTGGDIVNKGILNGYAKLTTSGDRTKTLTKNLLGKVYFDSYDGEINSKIGILNENILAAIISAASEDKSTLPYSCAILNFRVKGGVMNLTNSFAIETPVLNVVGNGGINLNTEKINILLKASNKSKIKIDELSTSNLIKIAGTLAEPKLTIDPRGVIEKGATIGLSLFTGGTSSIAKQILDIAEDEDEHPCQTAKKF